MGKKSSSQKNLQTKMTGKNLLLDTNILIMQLNGELDLSEELASAAGLYISAMTAAELYAGVSQADLMDLQDYLTEFEVLPVTSAVATLAGAYKSSIKSRGLKDLIIAATAQLHKVTLVTANKKDFAGITTISPIFVDV